MSSENAHVFPYTHTYITLLRRHLFLLRWSNTKSFLMSLSWGPAVIRISNISRHIRQDVEWAHQYFCWIYNKCEVSCVTRPFQLLSDGSLKWQQQAQFKAANQLSAIGCWKSRNNTSHGIYGWNATGHTVIYFPRDFHNILVCCYHPGLYWHQNDHEGHSRYFQMCVDTRSVKDHIYCIEDSCISAQQLTTLSDCRLYIYMYGTVYQHWISCQL